MNCLETSERLETFHDGELHGREMRAVALHVAQCATCEAQLAEWDRLHDLLNDKLQPHAEDLSAIWKGIDAGIEELPSEGSGWADFRIAAASTKVRRIFGGVAPTDPSSEDAADALWLRPDQVTSSNGNTFLRAGMALAASVFLAVFLLGDEDPGAIRSAQTDSGTQLALPQKGAPAEPTVVAARSMGRSGPSRSDLSGLATGLAAASAQHVQIHSVKQSGREMAMWAEPAGTTAVIWVGDAEPQARR